MTPTNVNRQTSSAGQANPAVDDQFQGSDEVCTPQGEVEAQWEWIDAIRELWTQEDITPKPYGAGTWGPSAAIALTERDGVTWHDE